MATPFQALGPSDEERQARLTELVRDFYDRVFDDPMIGFLFRGKDKARLIRLETQFTARFLGAEMDYEGRGMREAHGASRILGGHFERRQQLLREAFERHDIPGVVREAWLLHNDRLRGQVTEDEGTDCDLAQ